MSRATCNAFFSIQNNMFMVYLYVDECYATRGEIMKENDIKNAGKAF